MNCSLLDKERARLRAQNLTDSELRAPLQKEAALTAYLRRRTKEAKAKYKVDMGPLFALTRTRAGLSLAPNTAAFEAIERAPQYEAEQLANRLAPGLLARSREGLSLSTPVAATPAPLQPAGLPGLAISC